MRYLVRYEQVFWGEVLKSSYERWVESEWELMEIERALYSDPHVTSVEFVRLMDPPVEEQKQ